MKTKITIDSVTLPVGKKSWQVKGSGKTFFSKEEVSEDWKGQAVEIEYQENEFNNVKYLWIKKIESVSATALPPPKEGTNNDVLACNIATTLTCKIIENQKDITVERSVVVWAYFKAAILNSIKGET